MYQCFKYTNILVFSPSCLSCVRSEELHSRWLPFVFPAFDFILSLCSSTCLCLSPCLLSFSSCSCLFTHCSTRCQLWNANSPPPLQIVNETLRGRGSRAHWWLRFLSPPSSVFYMNICLSVFVSVCFSLAIFITVFRPVYSFALPCHFSVLYFVSLYPCTALSCFNESMTDVGAGLEMEPVIYFRVFCRACLGPDSPRPQTMLPWGLLVHAEMAHTRTVQWAASVHMHEQTTNTHIHLAVATDRLMFAGVSGSGSQNNTL